MTSSYPTSNNEPSSERKATRPARASSLEEIRLDESDIESCPSSENNTTTLSSLETKGTVGTMKRWKVQPWEHAFYHTTTSVLGIIAVVALPSSFTYLGWAGGIILLLTSAVVSFMSADRLMEVQTPDMKTYSDIADSVMWPGFANLFIRPLQLLLFFQVVVLNALVIGQVFEGFTAMSGGAPGMNQSLWIVVAGVVMLVVAMIPSLSQTWQLSLVGTLTGVAGTILLVIACGVSISHGSRDDISFGRPSPVGSNESLDYGMGVLDSFGVLAFAYGGHSVLPDIQASLHSADIKSSHHAMFKGLTVAYAFIVPCYLAITVLGYAAFGSDTSGYLISNIQDHVSQGFLILLDVFIVVNNLALSSVYMQAFFTLIDEIVPCLGKRYDKLLTMRQVLARIVIVSVCVFVAVAIPFFGSLAALTGAICFTPLTFIYPFVFWNRSELAKTASPWRVGFHWSCAYLFALLGLGGAIGAVYFIVEQSSDFFFFQ